MITLNATKALLDCAKTELITSGSQNVYQCQFQFDESWNGLDRTAVFRCGGQTLAMVLDAGNQCVIPWEVLGIPGSRLFAGVYGTDGDTLVLPTVWAELGIVQPGVPTAELGQAPTEDVYSQILNQSSSAAANASQALSIVTELAQDMQAGRYTGADGKSAYEIAVSKGFSGTEEEWLASLVGPAGPQGPKGDRGEKGAVPVKGVDYWTVADKAEIIASVVTTLPKYAGEVIA